ncbi:MAG: hypothetical protein IT210_16490 [Armatimonadetes bacterium]|nr:hypothetical protein [Armatimonadota bacterium]
MSEQQVLEVKQGIWIDERLLRDAGLGRDLLLVVEPGEIRILPAASEVQETPEKEAAWEVFRSLGKEARPGELPNAAEEHDRYLYGKQP